MQEFKEENIAEYRKLLQKASLSVSQFKGSEYDSNLVLIKLIEIEEFINRYTKDFTLNQVDDFEKMLSCLLKSKEKVLTRDSLLDKCIKKLTSVYANSLVDVSQIANGLDIELVKHEKVFIPPNLEKDINIRNGNSQLNFNVRHEPRVQLILLEKKGILGLRKEEN